MMRMRGADRDLHGVFHTPITASVLLAAGLVWVLGPVTLVPTVDHALVELDGFGSSSSAILGSLGRRRTGTATSPILGSAKPNVA